MQSALDRQTNFWNTMEPGRSPHPWQVQSLSRSDEIVPATSAVVAAMAEQGYKERDIFETTLIVPAAWRRQSHRLMKRLTNRTSRRLGAPERSSVPEFDAASDE